MARPSKFTPARSAKIIEGLRVGMTRRGACGHAGIDERTLQHWLHRYSVFFQQVVEVENEAESRYTGVLAKSAFGHEVTVTTRTTRETKDGPLVEEKVETRREYDWRAALEWLKRRRRKDWGDNIKLDFEKEVTGLLEQLVGGERADTED